MAEYGTAWIDVRGDTSKLLNDITSATRSAGGRLASVSKTVMSDLGSVAGAAALGVAGIGVAAAKVAADFDQAMSGVGAVANASAAEMDKLRESALAAGASTSFSATEAASAQAELVKAGVSVADTLGGALTGSLGLAAAGQLDLADAATISAQAMNLFKLGGDEVTHIADVLAAGANKSAADVGQLGEALRQGGLVAAQTGLGLEDTVGVLSMFADSALVGSDAGTSLKTMLQRLVPQSKESAKAMEDLGLNFFDAQGAFVGIEGVARQLQDSLGDLSDEQRNATLTTLFGSDAVRAASILMDGGAAAVRDYTAAVNDQGAAARMAAAQLDNLKGDVEELSGAIETALIRAGDLSTPILRGVTESATGFVDVFNDFATTPTWAAIEANVESLAGNFGGLFDDMAGRLEDFLGAISPQDVDRVFGGIVDGVSLARESVKGLEGVIAGLGISLGSMALRSIPLIGGLAPAISPITGILGGLVLGSEEGRKALKGLGDRFGEVAKDQGPELGRSLGGLADTLSGSLAGALEGTGEGAAQAAETLGPVLADAIDTLGPPLGDLIEAAGELAEVALPRLADLAGAVLPPVIGVFSGGLSIAADAAGFLADNVEILLPVLGGLAAWKVGSGLSDLGPKLAGIGGALKTSASDFGTYFSVLRSEGATIGGSLSGAMQASGGLSGSLAGALNPALLGVTAAAAAGVGIWQAWHTNVKRVDDEARQLSDTLLEQGKAVLPELNAAFQNILETRDSFDTSFRKSGVSIEFVTRMANEHTGALDETRQAYHDLGENLGGIIEDERYFAAFMERVPESMRPTVEMLLEMVRAGSLTKTEFEETLDAMYDLDEQAMQTAESIGFQAEQFRKSAVDVKLSADAQRDLATAMNDNATLEARRDALARLAAAYPDVAAKAIPSIAGVKDSTEDLAASAEAAVSALQALQGEMEKLAGARRDADEAERRLAEATARTAEAFKKGAGIDKDTEAGRANADAIQAQVEAAEALAEISAQLDPTGWTSTGILQAQADALAQMLANGQLAKDEYQALLDLYGLTPERITTTVEADTSTARLSVEQLETDLRNLDGVSTPVKSEIQTLIDEGKYAEAAARIAALAEDRTMQVKMDAVWGNFPEWLRPRGARGANAPSPVLPKWLNIPGHADGGPASPGWAIVGERGPELVNFSRPGFVYDAQQTARMLDGKSQSGAEFSQAQMDQLVAAIAAQSGTTVNVTASSVEGRRIGLDVADTLWLRGR